MKKTVLIFLLAIMNNISHSEVIKALEVSCATLNWPPYIVYSEEDKGYVFEIVTEAFSRAGYEAEVKFYPWARALAEVENGNIDVLFPEYFSAEREETCWFSDPIPGGPAGLMKRKDLNAKWHYDPAEEPDRALRALRKYIFGVVRGYINTEVFDSADYLKKDYADTDETNLLKLYHKRVDFIFIDKNVAEYIINTKYPSFAEVLEFMGPAMEDKHLYLAFSKTAPDSVIKLAAFNKALAEMKADGSLERIIKDSGY